MVTLPATTSVTRLGFSKRSTLLDTTALPIGIIGAHVYNATEHDVFTFGQPALIAV